MSGVFEFCRRPYRGYRLGYFQGLYGYLPMWRSSLESDWTRGYVYADDLADVITLAEECIDFKYREEAREVELGRPLTMADIIALNKEEA